MRVLARFIIAALLTIPCSFFIASADPARAAREQRAMLDVLVGGEGGESAIRRFFFEKTRELILRESYTAVASPVRSVDIVRDVFKAVPIHWVCELVRRLL